MLNYEDIKHLIDNDVVDMLPTRTKKEAKKKKVKKNTPYNKLLKINTRKRKDDMVNVAEPTP